MVQCKNCEYSIRFKLDPFADDYSVKCTKFKSGRVKIAIPELEDIGECTCYAQRGSVKKSRFDEPERGINIDVKRGE